MRVFLLTVLPLALAEPLCNKYLLGPWINQSAGYDEKNSVQCTCTHRYVGAVWDTPFDRRWPRDRQSPLNATCAQGEYCLAGWGDAICSSTPIAPCGNYDGTRSNEGACMCTSVGLVSNPVGRENICAPPFNYCDGYRVRFESCRPFDEACDRFWACGGANRRETCTVDAAQQKHICTCKTGYSGEHCEVGPCTAAPCKNGGTCTNDAASYRCNCPRGWSGPTCTSNTSNIVITPTPSPTTTVASSDNFFTVWGVFSVAIFFFVIILFALASSMEVSRIAELP